jgi:hypothetical protein
MPYLGEGQSVSFVPGGSLITSSSLDISPQVSVPLTPWTVEVETVVDGETTNYFLRTVRGICNYTWSEFPFGPATVDVSGSSYLNETNNRTFSNECIIKDYAVYPSGSYREGTDSASDWMGGNASIEIKNAADGGSDTWYVTVSKMDWYNKLNWDDADRIQDKERPWLSVFASGSAAATAILKPTQNSRGNHLLPLPNITGAGYQDGAIWNGYVLPRHIGYDCKKVASLTWNDTDKKWDVVQYILHQVELAIPYQQGLRWAGLIPNGEPPANGYQTAKDAHFDPYIENLSLRSDLASISGYTINANDWWFDLLAYTIPR